MGVYRLRAGFRDREGMIEAQELDEICDAGDVRSAVTAAKARLIDGIPEGTNIVWLTDEAGGLLWTQRTTDEP